MSMWMFIAKRPNYRNCLWCTYCQFHAHSSNNLVEMVQDKLLGSSIRVQHSMNTSTWRDLCYLLYLWCWCTVRLDVVFLTGGISPPGRLQLVNFTHIKVLTWWRWFTHGSSDPPNLSVYFTQNDVAYYYVVFKSCSLKCATSMYYYYDGVAAVRQCRCDINTIDH
jgi:hypothetical protein